MSRAAALESRDSHILIKNDFYHDEFFEWFGMLSDICPREVSDLPIGTCFISVDPTSNGSSAAHGSINPVSFLKLDDIPRPSEPVIGIISRQNKRFILNEHQLLGAVRALGFQAELLALEDMTAYEQMRALRSINILVGVHGSGLTNVKWMHHKCVVLQIVPHIVTYGVCLLNVCMLFVCLLTIMAQSLSLSCVCVGVCVGVCVCVCVCVCVS
jgi:hypothetical protein